jgi:hypothetical protein
MKIRSGFVSNSSSSSFVAFIPVQFFDELFNLFINMRFEGQPPSEEVCGKLKELIRDSLDTADSAHLGKFLTYTSCSNAGGFSMNSFYEDDDRDTFVEDYNEIIFGKKEKTEEDEDSEEDDVYEDDDEDYADLSYNIVDSFEKAIETMNKEGKVLSCGTDM